jgi:hypothetical protein
MRPVIKTLNVKSQRADHLVNSMVKSPVMLIPVGMIFF